jgi:hypothetical protein
MVFLLSVSSLALAVQPMDVSDRIDEKTEIQLAHEELAQYHAGLAAKMQKKITEQEALLEHYEDKSYQYGKRAQDLQSHTHALIRNCKKSLRTNLLAAASHRRSASLLKETHAAALVDEPRKMGGL